VLKAGLRKARELASGQIARASIVSMAVTVVGLALGFAQAVLSARLLGATNYGLVLVPMAIVQIVALLSLSGYAGLAVREIPARIAAQDFGGISGFVRHACLVVLALSTAAAVVVAIVAGATKLVAADYREPLEIAALIVIPTALIGLFRGLAQGFARVLQAQAPSELIRPAAMFLPLVFVMLLGLRFGPLDYMWLSFGTALLSALAAAAWLWGSERLGLSAPAMGGGARHFVAALPFLGLGLTDLLQGQMNTLLLGYLSSPYQAGLFQPVVRLAPVLMLPMLAAGTRFGPRIAELWQKRETDRIRWVTRTFTWTTSLITFALAVSVAAAGPWLMSIFGPEFRQSAPLLWYIAAAQVFNAACGPVGWLLAMSGRSGGALAGQLAGLAVNGLLGVLLIPAHGAFGAAIAMGSGIVVWNVSTLWMAIGHCGFNPSVAGFVFDRKTLGKF
jgi:O-antigen/teichoic acid export membrane protein